MGVYIGISLLVETTNTQQDWIDISGLLTHLSFALKKGVCTNENHNQDSELSTLKPDLTFTLLRTIMKPQEMHLKC